jgi:hypothetical protein
MTMSEHTRELSSQAWRHILWSNALVPVAVTVLMWGLYAVAAVFDVDVLAYVKRRRERFEPADDFMYLVLAIVFSAGAAAWAAYKIRRACTLARHGVEVVATIKHVGKLSMGGLVRVDYEYWLNGLRFQKAMSCLSETAQEYRDGTRQLVLVCDPRQPGRAMEKADVWPDAPPDEEPFEV